MRSMPFDLNQNGPEASRHPNPDQPLNETTAALLSSAHDPSEPMDPTVKARQRAQLLERVQPAAPASIPTPSPMPMHEIQVPKATIPAPTKKKASLWWAWVGGFAMAGAAIALTLVIWPRLGMRSTGPLPLVQAVATRLAIPVAHAGDAFSVYAEQSDDGGMNPNSAFVVTSTVDVSASDLQKALLLDPPVPVTVNKTGVDSFRVQPANALDQGKVYRFAIATTVSQTDGSTKPRDFSWAFQTKNDFRPYSTTPADGSGYVSVNSGIQINFSLDGFTIPTADQYTLSPSAKGHFEVHGRLLTFSPDVGWSPRTDYTLTIKKGFGITKTNQVLAKDLLIRFETTGSRTDTGPKPIIQLNELVETLPGKPITLSFDTGYTEFGQQVFTSNDLAVTGYRLDADTASSILSARLSLNNWQEAGKEKYDQYKDVSKLTPAFHLATKFVTKKVSDYQTVNQIELPQQDRPGIFALHLEPKDGRESWALLQVTNQGASMMADPQSLVVWALNVDAKKVLPNLPVRLNGQSVTTDASGIARLATPAALTATSTLPGDPLSVAIVRLGSGDATSLAVVRSTNYLPYYYWQPANSINHTWSYIYTDRSLFHPDDELQYFVYAQDRDTNQPVDHLTASLTMSDLWGLYGYGSQVTVQSQDLTPDRTGLAKGKMSWKELQPGYYTLNIKRGDELITSRSIEVRDFVKPAYQLSMTLDHDQIISGMPVSGSVQATFFDGTPVPNMGLQFAVNYGASAAYATTSADGTARFTIPSVTSPCYGGNPCGYANVVNIVASPTSGEEAQISASGAVTVYPQTTVLHIYPKTSGDQATISLRTIQIDLGRAVDKQDQPAPSHQLDVDIVGQRYVQKQTGTYYDVQTNQTYPTYTYDLVSDPAMKKSVVTNGDGRASLDFTMATNTIYLVSVMVDGHKDQSYQVNVGRHWYDNAVEDGNGYTNAYYQTPSDNLQLVIPGRENTGKVSFADGDDVRVQLREGDRVFSQDSDAPVLFVVVSRGIKHVDLGQNAETHFPMDEKVNPNGTVYALTFNKGAFQTVGLSINRNFADADVLNITAQTDKPSYRTGDRVTIHVHVTKADKQTPAANASLGYAAVDKALLSLSGDPDAAPLSMLNSFVGDGILFQGSTFAPEFQSGPGGAEKGGGGGDNASMSKPRQNFKDTAAFDLIQTDSQGNATIQFVAPDNLTSWRVEAVALNTQRLAGSGRVEAIVTQPVFVDAVLPAHLLVSDKPIFKLRAYGANLRAGTPITFQIKAPTLNIDQSVTGTAGQVSYIALDHLLAGMHDVTIGVQADQGRDAVLRHVKVDASQLSHDELRSVDAVPGTGLGDLGGGNHTVTIANAPRAAILNELWTLNWAPAIRADGAIASQIATSLLNERFHMDIDAVDVNVANSFQTDSGGMKTFANSTEDVELSSEVAATPAASVNEDHLAAYFLSVLQGKVNREQQIQALSGLVALRQPYLNELKSMMTQSDLNDSEHLAIIRGLIAAGDLEAARPLVENLAKNVDDTHMVSILKEGDIITTSPAATAEVAAALARLADPRADLFINALEKYSWSSSQFPWLARLRYVEARIDSAPDRNVNLTYSIDGSTTKSLTINADQPTEDLQLTNEQAKNFHVISVDGPLTFSYHATVAGSVPNSPGLGVARAYSADHPLDQLMEGDRVKVTLTPSFGAGAQKGCYQITDSMPGNMQPVQDSWISNDLGWYYGTPVDVRGNHVTFTACTGDLNPKPFVYTARVTTRGTYVAEPPIMQNLDYPAIGVAGQAQTIVTK